MELDGSSKWVLTADSYITSLSCAAGSIDLNGHSLYIDGELYDGGESDGEMIEAVVSSGGGHGGTPPEGGHGGPGGDPPEKP